MANRKKEDSYSRVEVRANYDHELHQVTDRNKDDKNGILIGFFFLCGVWWCHQVAIKVFYHKTQLIHQVSYHKSIKHR